MKTINLAWTGQNATCGEPNRQTGLCSMYGRLHAFSTRKERDEFVDYFRPHNPSEYAHVVNRKTARQYLLGMTMREYNDYINSLMIEC